MKQNKPKAISHGECYLFKSSLSKTAKKIKVKGNHIILANSEVTGNHHVIDYNRGVEFFIDENDTKFVKNSKPVDVKCVISERHSNITLEPGTWQVGIAQEFDYFTWAKKNVAD